MRSSKDSNHLEKITRDGAQSVSAMGKPAAERLSQQVITRGVSRYSKPLQVSPTTMAFRKISITMCQSRTFCSQLTLGAFEGDMIDTTQWWRVGHCV